MGLFDGVKPDDLPDSIDKVPTGTYKCRLSSVAYEAVKWDESGKIHQIIFLYKITEGPYQTAYPIKETFVDPDTNPEMEEDKKTEMQIRLLNRLRTFGVPDKEIFGGLKGSTLGKRLMDDPSISKTCYVYIVRSEWQDKDTGEDRFSTRVKGFMNESQYQKRAAGKGENPNKARRESNASRFRRNGDSEKETATSAENNPGFDPTVPF